MPAGGEARGDHDQAAVILGMGNPLLDISAVVGPEMLAKYNLKPNDAILYDKEDIFEDLTSNFAVEYIAGGATQNSCRVAQWVLAGMDSGKPMSSEVAFFGCVGSDENQKILKKVADEAGVNVQYQVCADKAMPTGRCAVLVNEHHRSLATKLDAANCFTPDHLEVAENWSIVEAAKIFYSAGFFITVSPDSMLKVAQHAAPLPDKRFCVNLSAPFIVQFFKEPLGKVLEFADIVIGNETELEAYAEHNGIKTSAESGDDPVGRRKEMAKCLAALPYKGAANKKRTVIVTQGCDPVIVVEDGAVSEHPVHPIADSEIVDTNGAGDAFVGGLLAQLARGKTTHEAIDCGLWAAAQILRTSGCKCDPALKYQGC